MKKITALLVVLLLMNGFVLPSAANADNLEKGFIAVSESTIKEINPNQAEISIGIETEDASVKKASEMNKVIANKINTALKPVLGKDDYIKTGEYSVQPQYVYTKDNKRVLDKYLVTNIVIVRTKNINLVSKLIDTATTQGATKIENLSFSSSNADSSCDEIMADLTKKAYNKANAMAKALNTQILGVKSISATCNSEGSSRPYLGGKMVFSAMDNASATPIESGKLKLFVTVNASFYVK